jgi:Ribbon-helix-helix protein, copG family
LEGPAGRRGLEIIQIVHMPQVLVRLDEATLKAIDRIAPAAKRQRADFIRRAVKDAIFQQEADRMRQAYRILPDSVGGTEVPRVFKSRVVAR